LKKVVVTGATGYLGSKICLFLQEKSSFVSERLKNSGFLFKTSLEKGINELFDYLENTKSV